jgi:ASC-1-like (ASCH) protein
MIKEEGLTNVLPSVKSIEGGVKIYCEIYKEKEERKHRVVAIDMSDAKEITVHEGKLQTPYYEYIRDGVKTYELRVYDEKRQKMKVGDEWLFKHNDEPKLPKIRTKITDKKIYKSFDDAIDETGHENLLPNVKSKHDAIKIYNAFDNGNYEKDAKLYGVVRFTIEMILQE